MALSLMLTTSNAAATREALGGLGLAYEEHDESTGIAADRMSVADLRSDLRGH